ncbi:MAG TPA: isocitrate/isopropylmalate family dehydrogenase [Polyangiaceae bacterium]|jgi:3-isopropylmalate dehydrogenase|nr:isocitrate/isopropylmalate family dehydrogenase [Polyangiaceae bacterium]
MSEPKKLVAVIPGDGIGPEVVAQGTRVLAFYRDVRGLPLDLWALDLGAERYLRDGTTFPPDVRDRIAREAGAVLLGALGDPRVPGLEHARDILFGLRFGLDLYANVRPVRALHDRLVPLKGRTARDVDLVVFRENTEGIYVGMGGQFKRGTRDEIAINEDVNTRKGVERLIRAGFDYARMHGKKRVHMADKSNAMRHAHELWYRVFFEVAADYPGIEARHVYVDALCLYLVQDPSAFEVIVTCNLFGDIVTDLGAGLQGGLGMAASANVHPPLVGRSVAPRDESAPPEAFPLCCAGRHARPPVGMFEPVHGSAPPLAGRDVANPLACVLTVGMLLAHLGWPEEEKRLEALVARAVAEKKCTADVGGEMGTRAVGDWIVGELGHAFG